MKVLKGKDFAVAVPGEVEIHKLDQIGFKNTMTEISASVLPPKDIFIGKGIKATNEFLCHVALYLTSQKEKKTFNFFRKGNSGKASWQFISAGIMDKNEKPEALILIAHGLSGIFGGGKKINKLLDEKKFRHTNFKAPSLLSKREKEIVKYIMNGKNSREIANLLFISKNTVDTHRKNINKKLQLKSRVALIDIGRNTDFA